MRLEESAAFSLIKLVYMHGLFVLGEHHFINSWVEGKDVRGRMHHAVKDESVLQDVGMQLCTYANDLRLPTRRKGKKD
jgi:hypothetical protein